MEERATMPVGSSLFHVGKLKSSLPAIM
jgi:hypothetical protein